MVGVGKRTQYWRGGLVHQRRATVEQAIAADEAGVTAFHNAKPAPLLNFILRRHGESRMTFGEHTALTEEVIDFAFSGRVLCAVGPAERFQRSATHPRPRQMSLFVRYKA